MSWRVRSVKLLYSRRKVTVNRWKYIGTNLSKRFPAMARDVGEKSCSFERSWSPYNSRTWIDSTCACCVYASCLSPELRIAQLLKLGASVVRCVQAAQRHGPVVIVTESDEHWVRGTAELLLPGPAVAYLRDIEVVSSRERFGRQFPEQRACWQIASFSYVTTRHFVNVESPHRHHEGTSGISRDGGSNQAGGRYGSGGGKGHAVERQRAEGTIVAVTTASRAGEDKSAMRTLRDHHPRIVAKTVSLIKAPTPQELRKQLDLLSDNFPWMFGYPRQGSTASVPAPDLMASTLTISPEKAKRGDGGNDDDARTNTTEGDISLTEEEEDQSSMAARREGGGGGKGRGGGGRDGCERGDRGVRAVTERTRERPAASPAGE